MGDAADARVDLSDLDLDATVVDRDLEDSQAAGTTVVAAPDDGDGGGAPHA